MTWVQVFWCLSGVAWSVSDIAFVPIPAGEFVMGNSRFDEATLQPG